MTSTIDMSTQPGNAMEAPQRAPSSTYQLEGEFRDVAPVCAFADGIRFLSRCVATVVSEVPGSLKTRDRRVSMDINGFVSPLDGSPMPSPAVIGAPGFDFPDLDFRLTGSAYIRSTEPRDAHLDGSVVAIEGWVNFESGELEVEAHTP